MADKLIEGKEYIVFQSEDNNYHIPTTEGQTEETGFTNNRGDGEKSEQVKSDSLSASPGQTQPQWGKDGESGWVVGSGEESKVPKVGESETVKRPEGVVEGKELVEKADTDTSKTESEDRHSIDRQEVVKGDARGKRSSLRFVYQIPKKYLTLIIKRSFRIPKTRRQGAVFAANWLMALSAAGLIFFWAPLWWVEIRYEAKETVRQGTFGELLKKNVTHALENAPDPYFSVVIPKIDARAKVLPNIDASASREYSAALREGVAHAKGTVFPGMDGTVFPFAHSAQAPWDIKRYNAVFYLLKEMEVGDPIILFLQGIRYDYTVTEKKVVPPTETGFFGQRGEELLVLQTCHPPGTTKEALLVFAKRETTNL